jgi:sigma54-dependent transcription regulator
MPLELQLKLLRVLQEQEFERLGSNRTQRVDVRILAATNVSLTQMVAEKKFRSDLYYRLNVFPIDVPPLRDRREDIPLLVRYFSNKYARRMEGKSRVSPEKRWMRSAATRGRAISGSCKTSWSEPYCYLRAVAPGIGFHHDSYRERDQTTLPGLSGCGSRVRRSSCCVPGGLQSITQCDGTFPDTEQPDLF